MSGTKEMLGEYDINISSKSAVFGYDFILVFPYFLHLKLLACDYSDCHALAGHLNASDVNRLISCLSSYANMSKRVFESS